MDATYDKGLVEVADEVYAYLQPDGSWGWSNAGLVVGEGGRCWSTRCSTST